MTGFGKTIFCALLFIGYMAVGCHSQHQATAVYQAHFSSENRPWTRWWWQGSSVTKEGITADLESLKASGLGGVELTPIYGVIGDEENFIPYLSDQWMDMLTHTLKEAHRLEMGVDIAAGTGWPFGGPWVHEEDACKYLAHRTYHLTAGERMIEKIEYREEPLLRAVNNPVYQWYQHYTEENRPEDWYDLIKDFRPTALKVEDLIIPIEANADLQGKAVDQVRFDRSLPLQTLMTFGPQGQKIDLTAKVRSSGDLDWVAPAGDWNLYALFQGWHGKMVERAAPGGEGNVIDHFSKKAIRDYLKKFDAAFQGYDISLLRAFFNDSYEVDDARGQANWTPDFFEAFKIKRGYDLRDYLPALLDGDEDETAIRVLSDFRETFSDLILENFTMEWANWSAEKNKIIRNQSHGSPANILDLYAASDIPETEGTQPLRIRFATSAAHVAGHNLVSAEAATWLNEHFTSNLADVKQNLDRYLVNGVNHLFYHGTCYSPPDETWPGRLFYAAIHNNNRNPLWHDWKTLNDYITQVQFFMQKGSPDQDVLLYFPMYDRYATPGKELLEHFDGHGPTLEGTPLEETALALLNGGYAFDFISDRQIRALECKNNEIWSGDNSYKMVVVPPCRFMPETTLQHLVDLATKGAIVVFQDHLPEDVPGLSKLTARQADLQNLKNGLSFRGEECLTGLGKILQGKDLMGLMKKCGIPAESMVDHDLEYCRRKMGDSIVYFITNWSENNFSGWVELSREAEQMEILDPMTGERGLAKLKKGSHTDVFLQLSQGQGLILIGHHEVDHHKDWNYWQKGSLVKSLTQEWTLHFLDGGPAIPDDIKLSSLKSWPALGNNYQTFSGRAKYSADFSLTENSKDWILDLGEVHETAQVYLNGEYLGTMIGPDYQIVVPAYRMKEENHIEIEVANLMANRIIDMDRKNKYWKKFYNINFPANKAENRGALGLFDASDWQPFPSGLLGPVTLTEINSMKF
ncbi:MAG: hypothetical protein KDC53_13465 [Saprospiraceae bacterium]|nr:hypothetical protein [Saprospiraceae bacterium]